jgi:hypothetical protein
MTTAHGAGGEVKRKRRRRKRSSDRKPRYKPITEFFTFIGNSSTTCQEEEPQ